MELTPNENGRRRSGGGVLLGVLRTRKGSIRLMGLERAYERKHVL